MAKLNILIAGGGTGGHLFPGLAIAEQIRAIHKDADIRFAGTARGIESSVVPQHGYQLYLLPVSGLYRVGFFRKILSLFRIPFALLKSLLIMITFRPSIVIGVGGYVSGPVLLTAILCGRKTVIQEQNASPGMTNRILGKLVSLVFVPFAGMEDYFRNSCVVGNPVRKAILDIAGQPAIRDKNRFQITIFGGSQGAAILNKTMTQALPFLQEYFSQISILHQAGKSQLDMVREVYQRYSVTATVLPFIDDMGTAYQRSNLLICRAGSSINEIIAVGRASILVPIANSSGNHQYKNAKTMEQNGAAILLEEREITPEKLAAIIINLLDNPDQIQAMEANARKLFTGNAAKLISEKIIAMCQP